MSAGQLKAIAVAVVVLLVLWGASELVSRRPEHPAARPQLPVVAAAHVDTITIVHGSDTVVLAKVDTGHWTVNGFAAAPGSVTDLLQAFRDSSASPPELVAESPESWSRMGVDSAGGRWVRVRGAGKTQAALIVGSHGADYDAFYLRLPGDPRVYQVHSRLAALVGRSVDDWRDHEIAKIPADSIHAVAITRGKEHFKIQKNGAKWTFAGGTPADSAAVKRLVERFASLSGSGFATPRTADSLSKLRPARTVTLWGEKGGELLSLAIDSTSGLFWVRRPGNPTLYRLDSWNVDQITPAKQSLEAKPKS